MQLIGGVVIADLALDATHVYITDQMSGQVARASKAGSVAEVIASGLTAPAAIAVDATDVYWSDAIDGSVRRAPKTGGAMEILASHQLATKILLDGAHVYWAGVGPRCASVFRIDK
jgi:hypothetical protein